MKWLLSFQFPEWKIQRDDKFRNIFLAKTIIKKLKFLYILKQFVFPRVYFVYIFLSQYDIAAKNYSLIYVDSL